ncbi:MAG: hypothetical protein M3N93_06925 [Acidobacteriota bacterium]|nr:hypothetical protein [Acidobacteriota bacterium]
MVLSAAAAFITFSLFGLGGDTVNFDNLKPLSFPPFWTATASRAPETSRWEVLRDATAPSRPNVLVKEAGRANDSEFSMAVFDKANCRDGDLSVKFRIEAGPHRVKTAGLVWRYQDQKNYYLLHFSVEEKNIVLFRVENGQAHAIPITGAKSGAFGVPHDLHIREWYVAKVIFRGRNIKVLFGNRQLFEAVDDSLPNAGKTGLWTRGATQASFDDFRIDKKGN